MPTPLEIYAAMKRKENSEIRMDMLRDLLQNVEKRNQHFKQTMTVPLEQKTPEEIAFDRAMKVL